MENPIGGSVEHGVLLCVAYSGSIMGVLQIATKLSWGIDNGCILYRIKWASGGTWTPWQIINSTVVS